MKFKFSIRDSALYNKVWTTPKGRASAWIKSKCENLTHRDRVTVVTVLLSAFILCAFFVFGHACYKLGLGEARNQTEVGHIQPIEVEYKKAAYEPETEVE